MRCAYPPYEFERRGAFNEADQRKPRVARRVERSGRRPRTGGLRGMGESWRMRCAYPPYEFERRDASHEGDHCGARSADRRSASTAGRE